jgi:predicted nucleotidyltransferase
MDDIANARGGTVHILLQGIVGSTAYGLAGPDSDVDRLGVFAWPTRRLFDLDEPKDSWVTHDPDVTLHEAAKYARLALRGNPTVMELMHLDEYEIRTPLGADLIAIREAFLSAKRTHDAYLGYATQQFRRLLDRGRFGSDIPDRRTAKHARHLMRLVDQGYELYTTGRLRIRLEDPQRYLDFGEQVAADPQTAVPFMAAAEERFASARTVLPDEPRTGVVQAWLNRVRAAHYIQPREEVPVA